MDHKEKLAELLYEATLIEGSGRDLCEKIAEHLIAHGIRLDSKQATELPKDFGRWIPVEERKPDLIPCSAGTAYSEAVNVLTAGHKVITAIWDGEDFIGDAEFWEAENEVITHWTPVLLPRPEPPKGE